jgi:hypothetical protein
MRLVLPVGDAGVLVTLVTFALGEDDALFAGLAEDEDEDVPEADEEGEEAEEDVEEEAADTAACVGVWLAQLGCGVGEGVVLGDTVELELLLGSPLDDCVPVVVGLGLVVDDGVPVVVGLGLGLLLAPALALVVLPLLWLEPDEVAGAAVVWVDLLGEPVVLCVADGRAEDEAQDVVLAAACGLDPLVEPPPGEGAGALLAPFALPPGGELLLVKAWLMALPTCTIAWRAGGTAARTTPMANTAAPTAKAGRSIASRQSLGRSGRCGVRFAPP